MSTARDEVPDPPGSTRIVFHDAPAFELPSGRIVTLEMWTSVDQWVRDWVMAGEVTE
jgi:hypothetical protein